MIKKTYRILFLTPESIGFDNYFGLLLAFLAAIVSFLGTLVNLSLKMEVWVTLSTFIPTILFSIAYYEGRIKNRLQLCKFSTLLMVLATINIQWFMNFGSYGPILYMFIFVGSFATMLYQGWRRFFILSLLITDITILFYLEYAHPEFFSSYPNRVAHLIDLYTGLLIYLGLSLVMLSMALNFYIKQKEKAEKADSLKSAFLANITHDIRTPMNAILGFSQLLGNANNPEKKQKYLNIINDNGEYLIRLIEDILDISKIEANQLEISFTDFKISTLMLEINLIMEQYLEKISKKHIKLMVEQPENELTLHSDKDRLKQILVNLLSNAAKFTDKGFIRYGYHIMPGHIEFFVEDTGIGIKQENLQEIFERFRKISQKNSTRNYRGTGIGLSISKQLVELLGGTISVKSEYGIGTRFAIKIPEASRN